jgi:LAGLIDADG endonuclease
LTGGIFKWRVEFIVHTTVRNRPTGRLRIRLRFQLTQHKRDEQLLTSFISYFQCGGIYPYYDSVNYAVT